MSLPLIGTALEVGGAAIDIGDKIAKAIPGKTESALAKGYYKPAQKRLKQGASAYGHSKAEQEQLGMAGASSRAQQFKGQQAPPSPFGAQTMKAAVAQKAKTALLQKLGEQDRMEREGLRKESRRVGREDMAADVGIAKDYVDIKAKQQEAAKQALQRGLEFGASKIGPEATSEKALLGKIAESEDLVAGERV